MPAVLQEPSTLASAPRRGSRSTWVRRVAVNVARLVILAGILVALASGWYLAKRGFGRQWRYRVVEELHKRGVEASIGRVTLKPFRGLVANNVRIFDYKNREKTLALISEVSLDVNYAALIHHEPFLNALDVRDAEITLPFKAAAGQTEKAQLTDFRAHVYFPPSRSGTTSASTLPPANGATAWAVSSVTPSGIGSGTSPVFKCVAASISKNFWIPSAGAARSRTPHFNRRLRSKSPGRQTLERIHFGRRSSATPLLASSLTGACRSRISLRIFPGTASEHFFEVFRFETKRANSAPSFSMHRATFA